MLKCTLNSPPQLIRTKNLNFDGDKLTVADYTLYTDLHNFAHCLTLLVIFDGSGKVIKLKKIRTSGVFPVSTDQQEALCRVVLH